MAVGQVYLRVQITQVLSGVLTIPAIDAFTATLLDADDLTVQEVIGGRSGFCSAATAATVWADNSDSPEVSLKVYPNTINDTPTLSLRNNTRRDAPTVSGNKLAVMRVIEWTASNTVSMNSGRRLWAQSYMEEVV